MRLTGQLEIAAPASRVWELIIDPTDLAACVPGVDAIRQVDATTFEGMVRAAIGPLDGQFAFTSRLTGTTFPRLVVDVEGIDSMTKSRVVAHVEATLEERTPALTDLRYEASVTTKGRLAIIGDMVLRATAGMMIGQVAACLRTRLEDASA